MSTAPTLVAPAWVRLEAAAPWLTAAAVFAYLLSFRTIPAADLSEYELQLAGIVHHGDPVRFPSSLYVLQLGGCNQLFFFLAWPLAVLFGAELATRVTLAAVVAAFAPAAARAARSAGRSPWYGVLVGPLSLGMPLRWGLMAYLLGVLVTLCAMPSIDALGEGPSTRRALKVTGWAMLAALAHLSTAILLPVLLAVQVVGRPWSLRRAALLAAPMVAPVLLLAWQLRRFEDNATASFRAITEVEPPRAERITDLATNLFGLFDRAELAVLCAAFLLAAVALALPWRPDPGGSRRRDLCAAGLFFAQYLAWPWGYHGAGLLFLRFLLPSVLLALRALLPPDSVRHRAALAPVALFPALMLALLTPTLRYHDAMRRALDPLVGRVRPGSSVAQIDFLRGAAGFPLFSHAKAHINAERGGRSNSFAVLPQLPLRFRPGTGWQNTDLRLLNPNNLVPGVDLQRYEYLLVLMPDPAMAPALVAAMRDSARPVALSGPWLLMRSTILSVPLTAPDAPLRPDRPPSLGLLLRRLRAPR